jgi:hypothetical protein
VSWRTPPWLCCWLAAAMARITSARRHNKNKHSSAEHSVSSPTPTKPTAAASNGDSVDMSNGSNECARRVPVALSQPEPPQPSRHTHLPLTHRPCPPQNPAAEHASGCCRTPTQTPTMPLSAWCGPQGGGSNGGESLATDVRGTRRVLMMLACVHGAEWWKPDVSATATTWLEGY